MSGWLIAAWWHTRCMTTAVLLVTRDGVKEFVRECHVHGVREGRLPLATGEPGAGLDAKITREVELSGLQYAETVEQVAETPESVAGGQWSMGHRPNNGGPEGQD